MCLNRWKQIWITWGCKYNIVYISKWKWFFSPVYQDLGTRHRYLRQGKVIASHNILWDASTQLCLEYMLLVPKYVYQSSNAYLRTIYPINMHMLLSLDVVISSVLHDDVIKWKHFARCWPFVRGIHRLPGFLPVNSPHKGQWRGALIFSLICAWTKRLIKQSSGWWFSTPSHQLWRHCNVMDVCGPFIHILQGCIIATRTMIAAVAKKWP